ncbi:hypothetical protein JAAARDRAFT_119297 [Jaapia argillacea MUCL 33604]|uniref:25S rRNA (uridine-N(3))-methyltransferase BMT5-like domain-containing protein n=1 Tax=Jaapia argillacea MUCL 33604 TaxID=933084 RepID=A0A067QHV6_9AGAM|nr:hypothetical protein JAAARDRAFT_119297 [Jaapia argillacea MUCL 33604]
MAKSKSLKAALLSHQSTQAKKQKATKAAQAAESKLKLLSNPSLRLSKSKTKSSPHPPTIPFKPTDRILLIGEGNFSFALSLALSPPPTLSHLPPSNLTATAYDSEQDCYTKYPDAHANVRRLKEKGVSILFSIDAGKLDKVPALKGKMWDRIVWNFPHAGKGITDQDRNIRSNQLIILDFLRSAAHILSSGPIPSFTPSRKNKGKQKSGDDSDDDHDDSENLVQSSDSQSGTRGTILVTLRNVPPYTLWDLPRLAKSPPPPASSTSLRNPRYTLLRSFAFHRSAYKGYQHRMTKGERKNGEGSTGQGGEDRCWEFCLRDEEDE